MVAGLAASGLALALALDMPLVLRVAVVGFFGGGALITAVVSSMRRLALRADASGVTIQFPLGFRPRRVPWPDAVAVVFWSQQVSARARYVGVLPRAEVERGFGRFSGRLSATSVSMNFFRLDRAAFEAAIRSYAAIPIVEWPTSVMGPSNDEVRTAGCVWTCSVSASSAGVGRSVQGLPPSASAFKTDADMASSCRKLVVELWRRSISGRSPGGPEVRPLRQARGLSGPPSGRTGQCRPNVASRPSAAAPPRSRGAYYRGARFGTVPR